MTEKDFKHWAFICHAPQDDREEHPDAPGVGRVRWASWLADVLGNFSTPADFAGHINARGEIVPDRIATITGGGAELAEGAGLGSETIAALEQSRYLVVICSPRAAQSRAVDEAVRHFKRLGRGNRILPIVIAGEPHARNASQPNLFFDDECFSPAMRHPLLPDGSPDENRLERGYIFADARHGDDRREILAKDFSNAEAGLERAKIQLIAGLIGVGFNGLWQREQKRRFAGFTEAQGQLQLAWQQTRTAQHDVAETQKLVAELQNRVRAAEGRAEEAEKQLDAARAEVRDAQKKVLDAQHLPADAKKQIEDAQAKALEAQQQVQQLKAQVRAAESQLEQARQQARAAEQKFSEAQSQAQHAESQVAASQNQVKEIQSHSRDSLGLIQEAEEQARTARSELASARQQTHEAEAQLQAERDKTSAARRLTKVFAVLAVLAALAVGVVWSQRKPAVADAAKNSEAILPDSATNRLDSAQIRLALQHGSDLDSLAARIPKEKISETLELAATILDDPQRSQFQSQLLDAWAKADAPAAFAWSCQLTNNEARQFALGQTVAAVAVENPTNILAQLNGLQPLPDKEIYGQLFHAWAAGNPAQAIEQRSHIPGRAADADILSAILAAWSERQPDAALNWLLAQTNSDANIPAGMWRTFTTAGLFAQWAGKDLEAASAASAQLPDGAVKNLAAEIILSRRIAAAPATATGLVTNLPPGDFRQNAITGLAKSWAEADAPAAFAWAQTLSDHAESTNVIGLIIGSWAQGDLPAATNGIFSLPDGEQKKFALLALTEPWVQQDPRGIVASALALPAGEVQTRWLTAACHQFPAADFARTAELLQPLADAALRKNLLEQAAQNFDLPGLDELAKTIAAMPAGDDQKAAIKGIVTKWLMVEPESAIAWLRAFPETNEQPDAIQFVIKSWSQSEPAAAAQWLASGPSGAVSEAMRTAFLDGAVMKYPEFAAQWTQSVTDEAQRQKFQVQVAKQWLKSDVVAAQKWIDSLNLPAKIKKTLK